MSEKTKIRVGSRKSELALIQTKYVISLLQEIHKTKEFEIITMSTLGDKILDVPLPKIGEKSLFTKELESALANGNVDFVVHSLKDLPTCLPDGMAIGAVLEREDPRDALVLQKDLKHFDLATLPDGSVIGTSSLRRTAQLSRKYPHLKVEDIRGNLNTRLRKLDELGKFQAIILAAAGLQRMGWRDRITKILNTDEVMYAVGQGALAIECRKNDKEMINLLTSVFDIATSLRILAERTFLNTLGGGCSAPVAIISNLSNIEGAKHKLDLSGGVWSLDGKEEVLGNITLEINLDSREKCVECPFKNKKCSHNDIECINGCTYKRESEDCERAAKKMKVNAALVENVPLDLLRNDPHEQCPVSLPVGADFMGKCPYLENQPVQKHIAVTGSNLNITKCPFFKDIDNNATTVANNSSQSKEISKYCGLVPHPNVPIHVMDQVEKLGSDLAELLINKGALTIMAKAQAYIRGS